MKTTVIEIPVELKSSIEHLVTVATKAKKKGEANRRLDCMRLEASMRDAARAVKLAGLEFVSDRRHPNYSAREDASDLVRRGPDPGSA